MPRVNIVKYDNENFAIFGDTKEVKATLIRCQCYYDNALKNPVSKKVMPGWTVTIALAQQTINALEKQGVKVYLNGK